MKARKRAAVASRRSSNPAPKVRPERHGLIHVELISVGRDLLRGRVVDRNAPSLASRISRRGALVHRITTVDDNERAIGAAILEALERNPSLVIVTGGLGPASDDRTLDGVSVALNLPLTRHAQAKTMVEDVYRRLADARVVPTAGITEAREKLYVLPVGSTPVPNARGPAPGVICRLAGGTAVLCLPGDPGEMESTLKAALPLLKDVMPHRHVAEREIESPVADEAQLRPLLDNLAGEFPSLWITSRPAARRTRGARAIVSLEAMGATEQEANTALDNAQRRLLALASGSP